MRELAPKDINRLIQIKGIVIRCSEIYPGIAFNLIIITMNIYNFNLSN